MDWKVAPKVFAVLAFAVVMAACAIALRPNGSSQNMGSNGER